MVGRALMIQRRRLSISSAPAQVENDHHCRDLGKDEPFDFLTWFEYAPSDSQAFEKLAGALRASEEWRYVEREVEIRLMREPA